MLFSSDPIETSPFNKAHTEKQLQAGGGFILPDFNEEQVTFDPLPAVLAVTTWF